MPGFSFTIRQLANVRQVCLTDTVGRSGSTSPPTRFRDMIRKHRYYDPLRLPNVHLSFLRLSLSPPIPCMSSFLIRSPHHTCGGLAVLQKT